jgi:hypothetical protein
MIIWNEKYTVLKIIVSFLNVRLYTWKFKNRWTDIYEVLELENVNEGLLSLSFSI